MEGNKVRLETINDIYHLINKENFKSFMLDFYKIFHNIAESKDKGEEKDWEESNMSYIDWYDDGENNIQIEFESKDGDNLLPIKF